MKLLLSSVVKRLHVVIISKSVLLPSTCLCVLPWVSCAWVEVFMWWPLSHPPTVNTQHDVSPASAGEVWASSWLAGKPNISIFNTAKTAGPSAATRRMSLFAWQISFAPVRKVSRTWRPATAAGSGYGGGGGRIRKWHVWCPAHCSHTVSVSYIILSSRTSAWQRFYNSIFEIWDGGEHVEPEMWSGSRALKQTEITGFSERCSRTKIKTEISYSLTSSDLTLSCRANLGPLGILAGLHLGNVSPCHRDISGY